MRTFVAALVFTTAYAGQAEQCAAYKEATIGWEFNTDNDKYKLVCVPETYDADKVCEAFKEDAEPSDDGYAANEAIYCGTNADADTATALTMGGAMIAIVGALAF